MTVSAVTVLVAIVVAIVAVRDEPDRPEQQVATNATPTTASAGPTLQRMPFEATAVATDGARLWAVGPAPTGGLRLAELDPATGDVDGDTVLPTSSASWVAFGAGHIWIGQGADGAEPDEHDVQAIGVLLQRQLPVGEGLAQPRQCDPLLCLRRRVGGGHVAYGGGAEAGGGDAGRKTASR